MDWLEEELKQALSRKEPSDGFDARVAAEARRSKVAAMPRRWLAVAAAVIVLAGASEGYRWRRGQIAYHRGEIGKVRIAPRRADDSIAAVERRLRQRLADPARDPRHQPA